jgi:TPR repeat protein
MMGILIQVTNRESTLIAANQGNRTAQERIADSYFLEQNNREAMHWYRAAAEQGSIYSQMRLAGAYQFGTSGLNKDLSEAALWYRRAAEAGDPGAADILGDLYEKGNDVPRNFSEAAKWYRIGAEKNFAPAQLNLGRMYIGGSGVPRDYIQGYVWLNLACVAGEAEACRIQSRIAPLMKPDQIEQARHMAPVR